MSDDKSKTKKNIKNRVGIVVSDKMDKTVVVKINRFKIHPKYKKRYKVSKKYKAHDKENKFRIGDKVMVVASRPLSKEKKWIAKEVDKK